MKRKLLIELNTAGNETCTDENNYVCKYWSLFGQCSLFWEDTGADKVLVNGYKRCQECLDAEIALTELDERDDKLRALEGAGVDNWEGYDLAMEMLENGLD